MRPIHSMMVVVFIVGSACDREAELDRNPGPAAASPVFTEHHFKSFSGKPTKGAGEECGEFGRAECVTGLCLHTKANQYRCSDTCRSAEDCPTGWSCQQAFPGLPTDVCAPPANEND